MKKESNWQVRIQKINTSGKVLETRISEHDSDENATDAMLAANDAAMEYESGQ